jgi:hypothetical protein
LGATLDGEHRLVVVVIWFYEHVSGLAKFMGYSKAAWRCASRRSPRRFFGTNALGEQAAILDCGDKAERRHSVSD